jgi:PKD repeat protein
MRLVRCIGLPLAIGLFLGCDSLGSKTAAPAPGPAEPATPPAAQAQAQAPIRLVYPADPVVYSRGVAIQANTPYSTGGLITSYRVNPALPAGLALDPATGVISGTPEAVAATASYEVTGSNSAGSTSVTLSLTVNDQAPAAKPVVTLAPFLTEGTTGLSASTKDLGKGMTYAWTLRGGSITAGQGAPAITFTAGSAGALTASVAVGNTGGSLTGSAEATVVPAPDATLTAPQAVAVRGSSHASVPGQPGMTYLWTILPGAATATITSGQGTREIDFQAGANPGTVQLQVRVQNQAGHYLTNTGTVKVQTGY